MEQIVAENLTTIEFIFTTLPWILIGIWFLYTLLVVAIKPIPKVLDNYYIIQSIPSVFVTLGLFGTFTGIAFGLLQFNTSPDQIKDSIKILLDGLKLAMFTSITGILLSLIFSKILRSKKNRIYITPPDSPELQELRELNRNFFLFKEAITTSQHNALVESLREVLSNFNEVFQDFIDDLVQQNFTELKDAITQIKDWQQQHRDDVETLTKSYQELVSKHQTFVEHTNEWVNKLDEITGQSSRLQVVIDEFNEAFNEDGNLSRILAEIRSSTSELQATTENFTKVTEKMNTTTDSIEVTGSKISEWTNAVQQVSDASQSIVDQVSALQKINKPHIDNLVDEFNESLKGTFSTFDALVKTYMKSIDSRLNKN